MSIIKGCYNYINPYLLIKYLNHNLKTVKLNIFVSHCFYFDQVLSIMI